MDLTSWARVKAFYLSPAFRRNPPSRNAMCRVTAQTTVLIDRALQAGKSGTHQIQALPTCNLVLHAQKPTPKRDSDPPSRMRRNTHSGERETDPWLSCSVACRQCRDMEGLC